MFLAIIAMLSSADAHPVARHYPITVRSEAVVGTVTRWVEPHYDSHGRWIRGHWITVPRIVHEICRIEPNGRTWCKIV